MEKKNEKNYISEILTSLSDKLELNNNNIYYNYIKFKLIIAILSINEGNKLNLNIKINII